MQQLRGRSAILTGASRAIGPHIARSLAAEGIQLALVARSGAEVHALANEIGSLGVRAVPIVTDITSPGSREALVASAEAELGAVDILVNNAGTHHAGPLHTRTATQVDEVVEANLTASIDLTRRLLPAMLRRTWCLDLRHRSRWLVPSSTRSSTSASSRS
jgi:short-subunit dehydrogenase